MAFTLTLTAIMLMFSALASCTETALLSCSRARLHQHARHGNRKALAVLALLKQPDLFIGTILIVNTLVAVASSALVTDMALRNFGPLGAAIATGLLSVALLMLGEAFPKALGTRFPEGIALALYPIIGFSVKMLLPVTTAIKWFNHGVLSLMGLADKSGHTFTEADLRGAINLGLESGALPPAQHRMLDAIMDLSDLTIADVMIHRSSIASINLNTPPAEIPQTLGALKHSRVVVYEDKPENLIGFLYVRDYLTALAAVENRRQVNLKDLIRPLYFVPETSPVNNQLFQFLTLHHHIALVVDEYGDLQGLITLEDILEEIVGDITDEHDIKTEKVEKQADGSLTLPANKPVRDINRRHHLGLPEDSAVTLAGLVTEALGHLPAQGESVQIGKFTLTVTTKRGHKLEKITLKPNA